MLRTVPSPMPSITPNRGRRIHQRSAAPARWPTFARLLIGLLLTISLASTVRAQYPPVHYLQSSQLPPGTVGQGQLLRGGPLAGYFQPVEVRVPEGVLISLAQDGHFGQAEGNTVAAGLLIGQVYRFRIANIPLYEGIEVYPSVELINRLYPPPGKERMFPIPVRISQEELELALNGQFVTRVIYLEDPNNPLPVRQDPKRQQSFDVRPDQDPLQVADQLGRPMAILRLGSRVPDRDEATGRFTFGMPPLVKYPPLPETIPMPPATDAAIERETRDYPRLPLAPRAAGAGRQAGAPWTR